MPFTYMLWLCIVFVYFVEPYRTDLTSELLNSTRSSSEAKTGSNYSCNARPYVESWTKENFPNPQIDIEDDYCGRNCKSSWICDPEHLISQYEANQLDRKIEEIMKLEIRNRSNCIKGRHFYSISVGIVTQINNRNIKSTSLRQRAAEFANYLRIRKWNYSSCDSDVVILLSRNDKLIEVSTGSAVRQVLSNDCLDSIHNETSNQLRQVKFGAALYHMVKRFGQVLKYGTCFPPTLGPPESASLPSEAVIAGVGVFVVLLGYGTYMIKTDMDRKSRKEDDKLRRSPRLHRKRKHNVSPRHYKNRKLSRTKEEITELQPLNADGKLSHTKDEITEFTPVDADYLSYTNEEKTAELEPVDVNRKLSHTNEETRELKPVNVDVTVIITNAEGIDEVIGE